MPRDPKRTGERKPPAALPSPLKPPGALHGGGRPPGSQTLNQGIPGLLPGGTPRQSALRAPAPAPTRQGVETKDRRQAGERLARVPGEANMQAFRDQMQATSRAVPGSEEARSEEQVQDRALVAADRGLVPGASAEGEPGSGKPVFRMERNIHDFSELDDAPVGIFQTPQGTLEKTEDGKLKVRDLSPEAKMRVKEIEVEQIQRFGDFPGMDDPSGQPPPVKAGQPWFNPFTGTWGDGGHTGEVSYLEEEGGA